MYEDIMQLFEGDPGAFALYLALESRIKARWPDVEIRPKKTQVGFFHSCGFVWAWPARQRFGKKAQYACIGVSLGMPARIDSPRIQMAVEPYPGRWTNHMRIASEAELDDEFFAWLEEAHTFAQSKRAAGRITKREE